MFESTGLHIVVWNLPALALVRHESESAHWVPRYRSSRDRIQWFAAVAQIQL